METAAVLLRCFILHFTSNVKCLQNIISFFLYCHVVVTFVVHTYYGCGAAALCNNELY
jgi:hypothetical protein